MMIDLFDRGMRSGLIASSAETRAAIDNLSWRARTVRTEESSSAVLPTTPEGDRRRIGALDALSWSLAQSEDLQSDLNDLVESEFEFEDLEGPSDGQTLADLR